MENENDKLETEGAEKFAINSESAANWLLSKMAANNAEAERRKTQAAARCAELRAENERLWNRFGGEAEAWGAQEAAKRRRKTITLDEGNLVFRTAPARLVISDGEAAFVNARTVCPDAIQRTQTETLDKAAYIAFAEATGDLTGLEQLPARETFGFKFPGTGKNDAEGEE